MVLFAYIRRLRSDQLQKAATLAAGKAKEVLPAVSVPVPITSTNMTK
jgi:hypothetical protein